MKSLVVGSNSFLGGYLSQYLRESLQDEVVEVDKQTTSGLCCDPLNKEDVHSLLEQVQPDRIFCLSGVNSIGYAWEHPHEIVDLHIIGALNMLDSVKDVCKDAPILLVGSGEEYGRIGYDDLPIREDHALAPENIYSVSKVTQNMIAQLYHEAFGLHIVIARSFNDIGPGQANRFALSSFCEQIAKIDMEMQAPLISVGNLSIERDFTDVRDTIRAFCALIEKGRSGEIYNVGSGKRLSLRAILALLLQQCSKPIRLVSDISKIRPNDIPVLHADISKITHETGWAPQIPIEQTLADMIQYWRDQLHSI